MTMYRNKSVDVHDFAMVPSAEIPRSKFKRESTHKTTFDAGYLIPIYCDEVLPGDVFNMNATFFARMSTPIFPLMDNLYLDSFFFFIPNRLVQTNFVKIHGERDNPADSISFIAPISTSPVGGYAVNSLQDYMGLPTVGQVGGADTFEHNTYLLRAYNLTWNDWFRDQNLQDSVVVDKDDGPDTVTDYVLLRRGKRHDYFTSCLPWQQKGDPVVMPLGTDAQVKYNYGHFAATNMRKVSDDTLLANQDVVTTVGGAVYVTPAAVQAAYDPGTSLYADLSTATAATISQLRESFQIQKLLERDARGGTRYTEIVRAHFGVTSPDARLQRPEYLGGKSTPININPIAQTSATGLTGGSTPAGELVAFATVVQQGTGFSASFTEHGVIIGLVSVRADLTYQQGLHKMWSRSTRYDFYYPAFAHLSEQAVLSKEIYCDGSANDEDVLGYQERWAELRYAQSKITGLFRSTSASTIDPWHAAQKFTTRPTLDTTFIQDTPPIERVVSVGAAAAGKQFIFDAFFDCTAARPLPMYSVPGLIDHF